MYIVLVGPPGCRKNSAINIAIGLISDIPDVKFSADATTRESLIKAICQSQVQVETAPGKIATHSPLTVISKELSVFIGSNNIELLSLLTDLYDPHDRWEYRTISRGSDTIHGVWLNMLAGTTPTWLVGSIPMNAIGGGFTSRIIFVVEHYPRKKTAIPVITEKEVKLRNYLINDLEQISMIQGRYKLNDEAIEWFVSWYETVPENPLSQDLRFSGYCERKHIHLLKAAIILAACKSSELVITAEDLVEALTLLDMVEPKMIKAFGSAGRSLMAADIDDVVKLLEKHGRMSREQLLRSVWRDISPEHVEPVIRTLKDMNIIEQIPDAGVVYYQLKKKEEK
jgi:hypothetical protein